MNGGLFLSVLRLNPRNPAARRDLRDVCAMHATVERLCDGMPEGPRVLWAQPWPNMLVVRSTGVPDSRRLRAGYLAAKVETRPWLPPAGLGRYRAVAVVNPVARSCESAVRGARGVVTPIRDRRDQEDWMRGLLAPMMDVLSVLVVDERTRKGQHRDGRPVVHRLATVRFEGVVVEPRSLAMAALQGFGRARAYGGGLTVWEPGEASGVDG